MNKRNKRTKIFAFFYESLRLCWAWIRKAFTPLEVLFPLFDQLTSPLALVKIFEPIFILMGKRSGSISISPLNAKRILITKLDLIGDVVLTLPLVKAVRADFPEAHISLVVERRVLNLVELCPYVDVILPVDCRGWSETWCWRWKYCLNYLIFAAKHLWSKPIDLAINPQWGVDHVYASALAYLSGARFRIGYSEHSNEPKQQDNSNYDVFYTYALNEPAFKHDIEYNLGLLRVLGLKVPPLNPEMWLSSEDEQFAERLLSPINNSKRRPLVALCPGASSEHKEWPIERFSMLSQWMIDNYGATLLIIGGTKDKDKAKFLISTLRGDVINAVWQ